MRYETVQSYQPIRTPAGWNAEDKKLIVQLTDILDDLYKRFNRLRFEDLGEKLRNRIEESEGYTSSIDQTAKQILLTVSGGSAIYEGVQPETALEGDLWRDEAVYYRYESGAWVDTGLSNLITRLGQISQTIISASEIVSLVASSEVYKADMLKKAEDFEGLATETYVQETNATEITQRNNAITLQVSQERERSQVVEGEIKTFTEKAQTYFEFKPEGLLIGVLGSPFKTLLGNEKLSFQQSGVEVAFIQHNKLFIKVAEITDKLTVGNPTVGYTDMTTKDGGFSGRWRAE